MARRALRKIDPALDLSGIARTLDDMPRPWSAATLFGREAPLEIEIGSGKGLFLSAAAAAKLGHDFLGIEVVRKYALAAAARAARAGLENVRVLAGDGLRFMAEFLPSESADAIHIYFPDPWWKKRHRKRRVFKPSLVQDVERTLRPGGKLHFWTDVEEYFHESLDLLATETKLVGSIPVEPRPPEHDLDYRTHYERRTRLAGLPVFRSEFRKTP